jgi:glycosyltransferase involved in cell wall biosynthesis
MDSQTQKIKVLQIIDALRPGGKERQLVELLTGLADYSEIECSVFILSNHIQKNYLKNLRIRPYIESRKFKKDPKIFLKLYQVCRHVQPDIIHSWESMCSIYALPIAKILKIKFVNGFLRYVPPRIRMSEQAWLRSKLTFPFSDIIVANSYAGLKAFNVPHSKGICIHNGFNLNRTKFLVDKNQIRFQFDIDTKYIVGMVANFTQYKDYKTFIRSAINVLNQRNDVTFIAVGKGEDLNALINMVPNTHKHLIKFLGHQNDVESIINIFDIGVLLSSQMGEGISNSIMEYMALGKPVIATDCPGNHELVIDGQTGFLVAGQNACQTTDAILKLLEDKNLASISGEKGKKRIMDEFNLPKMTRSFVSLYKELYNI